MFHEEAETLLVGKHGKNSFMIGSQPAICYAQN
jgi:hypothetical protein